MRSDSNCSDASELRECLEGNHYIYCYGGAMLETTGQAGIGGFPQQDTFAEAPAAGGGTCGEGCAYDTISVSL